MPLGLMPVALSAVTLLLLAALLYVEKSGHGHHALARPHAEERRDSIP